MSKRIKQVRHKAGAYTFYLKPLPRGPLLMALSDNDKPQVPNAEVEYAGGVKVSEPDPNNPAYQEALETWNAMYKARLFRLCITRGIDRVENGRGEPAEPTGEDLEDVRFIYGANLTRRAQLLHWYADILGDTAMGFMNLAMGQTQVTEEGLAEAEDRFRADGEGAGLDG